MRLKFPMQTTFVHEANRFRTDLSSQMVISHLFQENSRTVSMHKKLRNSTFSITREKNKDVSRDLQKEKLIKGTVFFYWSKRECRKIATNLPSTGIVHLRQNMSICMFYLENTAALSVDNDYVSSKVDNRNSHQMKTQNYCPMNWLKK